LQKKPSANDGFFISPRALKNNSFPSFAYIESFRVVWIMVVDIDKIPAEVLRMSELEFSEFFQELLRYMDKQQWNHLTDSITENKIDDFD